MEFKLSKEQKQLKKGLVRFAKEMFGEEAVAARANEESPFRALWKKCGERSLPGLNIPASYSGLGYNAEQSAIALQGFASECRESRLLTALVSHMFGGVMPLILHGSESQKQTYLEKLASSWVAASPFESLSSLEAVPFIATRGGDGFILDGEKVLMSNALAADLFMVYAVTDTTGDFEHGITCFLVEKDAAGVQVELGDSSVATEGLLTFNELHVGEDAIVGGLGNGAAVYRDAVTWERSMLAAVQVGVMERLVESSIKHARSHESDGRPIGKNQSVSHKITDMKIRLEIARLLSYKAAWQLDRGDREGMDASIAKLFSSESMVQSSLDAVQIFGSQALPGGKNSVQEALSASLYSGSPADQRRAIARTLELIESRLATVG